MTIPLKQALVTIFNSNGSPCQFRLRILIRSHNNVITDVHIYICITNIHLICNPSQFIRCRNDIEFFTIDGLCRSRFNIRPGPFCKSI